jgi:hypothetical protein
LIRYSNLTKCLEQAWGEIQKRHPDVPSAVIVVGSGGRKAPTTYGHFASNVWEVDGEPIHEVLIVAEQLNRPAEEVFQTLLHESVHGIANKRQIKDVSGKRHNKRFATLCWEVGLQPPESAHSAIGWSAATLLDQTKADYSQVIELIGETLNLYRKLNLEMKPKVKNSWAAECPCGVKIRVGKKVYDGENIFLKMVCTMCDSNFVVDDEDNETEP